MIVFKRLRAILVDNEQVEFSNRDLFLSLYRHRIPIYEGHDKSLENFSVNYKKLWRVVYRLESFSRGSNYKSEERFLRRAHLRIFCYFYYMQITILSFFTYLDIPLNGLRNPFKEWRAIYKYDVNTT